MGGKKRGWLRPLILRLLLARPMNGVEIMDEIEKMTGGTWRPSPGSVYPMLAELLNEGLVVRQDDGRYELTEQGRLIAQAFIPLGHSDPLTTIDQALVELERLARENPEAIRGRLEELREIRRRLEALDRFLSG
ncbi:MAG: helix-turn-helix transcriptional regulator [Acidilobus sp.]